MFAGLHRLHVITRKRRHRLRIDLRSYNGAQGFAEYYDFKVHGPHRKYRLTASGYSGNAGIDYF